MAILPDDIKWSFNLVGPAGDFNGNCLSSMNDTGSTFAEIADLIEAELEAAIK